MLMNPEYYRNPELAPELLITMGGSLISKKLKQMLRRGGMLEHWHITSSGIAPDTFQSLSKIVELNPLDFLLKLYTFKLDSKKFQRQEYANLWKSIEENTLSRFNKFMLSCPHGDLAAVWQLLDKLPDGSTLHLGNSMPVRYASMIGLNRNQSKIHVYANRGTSGIDGCLSTAVGHAMTSRQLQVILLGDMTFFYDSNAFWHKNLNNNLRIVILNNEGGGIFRIIEGPNQQPELETFFECRNRRTAEWIARDFDIEYAECQNRQEIDKALKHFFDEGDRPKIMEIFTDPETNQDIYQNLITYLNN
jgi:2-succinyl-5-enolpyruvyl-6-hydroxy-3-cyclohexene-1-carboxylate synthase